MMGSLDYRPRSSVGFSSKKAGHASPLISIVLRKDREKEAQMQMQLQERVKGLEEERSKIEAFKRELPLCMQLLNDAIEASKERLATHIPSLLKVRSDLQGKSMVGPVKRHSTEDAAAPSKRREEEEHLSKDQAAIVLQDIRDNVVGWEIPKLVSQQENLGNEGVALPDKTPNNILRALLEHPFGSTAKPFVNSKPKLGGAFSPFQREKQAPQPVPQSDPVKALPDHTPLSSNNQEVDCTGKCEGKLCCAHEMKKGKLKDAAALDPKSKEGTLAVVIKTTALATSSGQAEMSQLQKKTRRCWSPELHLRFVNALQQLGGPQVATPKQIRELMNIEGLTNDEVKSHLQKYRLHARRCSPTPTTVTAVATPQLVLLGWAAPGEYSQQSQTPPLFNSNPHHPHLCKVAIPPQDYFSHQANNPLHPPTFYEQPQPSPTRVEGGGGEPFHSLASSAEVAIREESADGNSENSENSEWKATKKRTRQSQWSGEDRGEEEEEEVTNTQESCHSLSSSTSQKCLA